ncbi:T3SS effector HopA1 family protein [Nocardia sp. NPDC050175]|uniref:T3SS effector HopA1 family protein n=1 Tax=Nocardia sp. NPDC050175 TaxID=3364317 RepID=UPI0037A48AFC
MPTQVLTEPRALVHAVDLAHTAVSEIVETTFDDDKLSLTYRGRKLDGSVTEVTDLLAECLYATLHAKYLEVFDDSAAAEFRPRSERLTAALGDVFRDRLFPLTMPVHHATETGPVILWHRGLKVHCPPDRLTEVTPAGDRAVLVEHYSAAVSPGFYYVFGQGALDDVQHYGERTYVSVPDPADIVTLAPVLVTELDRLNTKYHVKFLTEESTYPRTDTVAIYHDSPQQLNEAVITAVAGTALATGAVSDYCLEIGPGIGRAQEPVGRYGRGRSFGQHRSGMLADAIVHTLVTDDDLATTCLRLAAEYHVDPECLALNRG